MATKFQSAALEVRHFFQSVFSYFKYPLWLLFTSIKSFFYDDCYTKASTLTFYSLQSLIPLLAFAIALAKGFGFEEYLEDQIKQTFEEQKEVLSYAITFAHSMLTQIAGSVIVGFGVLLLLWTTLNLLGYVELTFNSIWKVKTPRTFYQKVKDYLVVLILCPIVFTSSSALTVYFRESVSSLQHYAYLETLSSYLLLSFKLTPFFLTFLLFLILYIFIPNTQIRFTPRLIAAFIAGAAFQLWQIIFIEFQVQLFSYNIVYGTFAVVPLFFIWLQFSWLIVLMGAEIAANIENKTTYDIFIHNDRLAFASRKQLGLVILSFCLRRFYDHKEPLSIWQVSNRLKIPINLTQELLDTLEKNKVLTLLSNEEGEVYYLPTSDPELFSIKDIADFFDSSRPATIETEKSAMLDSIIALLEELDSSQTHSQANLNLKDLYIEQNK